MTRVRDTSWKKIFNDYNIHEHDFSEKPFIVASEMIKASCQDFKKTGAKEVRILCKQDSREDRPEVFCEHGLFLLPVKNGMYAIIQGEGYVDIPDIESEAEVYTSNLDFTLDTSGVGDSEMQHLDYAYATSLIRSFAGDDSLVLTVRGRKYAPKFSFAAGDHGHTIGIGSVQTEVDAGYEGKEKVVLVEAKNSKTNNVIIRQIYYPFRQWQYHTDKPVELIFFEKRGEEYCIWNFDFEDVDSYNSIRLIKSARYNIRP